MTKLAQNPVVLLVLGLLGGTAAGLVPLWRAGEALVAAGLAVGKAPAVVTPEEKAQGWDFWTIEIDSLANELKGEKARLQKEAESLGLRTARLETERQELAKVRGELEQMRAEIGRKVIEISGDEMKNLKGLAQTYSNLTPRAAVAILKELDDLTAVKILALMKPDTVSPIFEEMSRTPGPDGTLATRAAALSEKLRLMKSTKSAS